jgi:hypothetical protein
MIYHCRFSPSSRGIKNKEPLYNIRRTALQNLCPHGDSNPGLGLERAASWASRRWGRRATFYHADTRTVIWRASGAACLPEMKER